jgi:hypothetical protein
MGKRATWESVREEMRDRPPQVRVGFVRVRNDELSRVRHVEVSRVRRHGLAILGDHPTLWQIPAREGVSSTEESHKRREADEGPAAPLDWNRPHPSIPCEVTR